MKRKFKKIAIIFFAAIIIFTSSIAIPYEQQKAYAISIPIALQGAAGVYVIGGILVAAGVGAVGYDEYADEINAHAQGVWNGATQLSADALNWSIEAAQGIGNGIVGLQGDFINFIEGKLDNIAMKSVSMTNTYNDSGATVTVKKESSWGWSSQIALPKDQLVMVNGQMSTANLLTVKQYNGAISYSMAGGTWYMYTSRGAPVHLQDTFNVMIQNATTIETVLAVVTAMGGAAVLNPSPDLIDEYNAARARTQEQWETMRDAGLVLPIDSFVPTSAAGEPLTYNPATGELTGIDGGVYTGDHTWQIPNVSWRDKSAAVPETGVWVETPVAIPGVGVGNPAIPNTITNITTGTTVLNPDIPIEGDLPGGGTPPPAETENPWNRPPTKKPPNIGGLVTTKFPFSLPWDFFGVLGWLNAEPKAPVFKLDTVLPTPFGNELKMDMKFEFDFLDPYMGYFRSFIIIGFSLFLILATRKLMGGAG